MGKQDLNEKIEALMKDWAKYCQSKWQKAVFVKDGPFAFYEEQKKKILFIGRELPGKINEGEEGSCIDYRDERFGMNRLGLFQRRLLYLAYGIQHGEYSCDDWYRMPEAQILDKVFAEDAKKIDGAFSYAFMNASKLLNTKGTKTGEIFTSFIQDGKNRKFFIREVELLAPDIIVSGNLNEFRFFDNEEFRDIVRHFADGKYDNGNCFVWEYKLQDSKKTIPCLDGWHFSAPKAHFEGFYQPICSATRNYYLEMNRNLFIEHTR